MSDEPWYGVRLVYQHTGFSEPAYEERILIVRATTADDAIARAEALSNESYESESTIYVNFAMAFNIYTSEDFLREGVEVFSLVRKSNLTPDEYIDRFHDSANECAR